jgi:excisionase family DNA binding protein
MLPFSSKAALSHMEPQLDSAGIMTIKDVADYLKVTERTIYRLAAAKQVPAFKVGGSWRFSKGDLDHWIREQSKQPSGTPNG